MYVTLLIGLYVAIYAGLVWFLSWLGIAVLKGPAKQMGRSIRFQSSNDSQALSRNWRTTLFAVTILAAVFAYLQIKTHNLNHTALMFVGLPALLALGLIWLKIESPRLLVIKGITVFLLLSSLVLGEGLICVIMAAPIFYVIGMAMISIVKSTYRKDSRLPVSGFAILLVVLSMEGVHPSLSFDRNYSVSASDTVSLSSERIQRNLEQNPDFSSLEISPILHLGFPKPVSATGSGLNVGDEREFVFQRYDGTLERVSFTVTDSSATHVDLSPIFDDTKIGQWLSWQGTHIEWESLAPGQTEITVQLSYRRELDPAWYFGPIQKLVVKQAARTMISHATQQTSPTLLVAR